MASSLEPGLGSGVPISISVSDMLSAMKMKSNPTLPLSTRLRLNKDGLNESPHVYHVTICLSYTKNQMAVVFFDPL